MTDANSTATEDAPTIWSRLPDIEERLARSAGILLLLDFDGTLAPIEDVPQAAGIPTETQAVLEQLSARPGVEVAIVTGRQVADVRQRVDLEPLSFAGNHGLRIRHGAEEIVHPDARETAGIIEEASEVVADRLADLEGCFVEQKGLTATVHYRQAPDGAGPTVREAIDTALEELDPAGEIVVTNGKQVYELRPPVDWDKGRAVEWLRDRFVPDGERWLPFYIGDDTTDEAAFQALDEGVTVKVGKPPLETAARYRLDDPAAVRTFLSWLDSPGADRLARETAR